MQGEPVLAGFGAPGHRHIEEFQFLQIVHTMKSIFTDESYTFRQGQRADSGVGPFLFSVPAGPLQFDPGSFFLFGMILRSHGVIPDPRHRHTADLRRKNRIPVTGHGPEEQNASLFFHVFDFPVSVSRKHLFSCAGGAALCGICSSALLQDACKSPLPNGLHPARAISPASYVSENKRRCSPPHAGGWMAPPSAGEPSHFVCYPRF